MQMLEKGFSFRFTGPKSIISQRCFHLFRNYLNECIDNAQWRHRYDDCKEWRDSVCSELEKSILNEV